MMKTVIVIGAGAVGLATAYCLRKSGCEVTVIDSAPLAAKASGHNAGWLIPSMSTPVPAPGMLLQAARWMVKRDGPFYVTPSLKPSFVSFMLNTLRNSNAEQFALGSSTLAGLSAEALSSYDDLRAEGVDFEMHEQPLTMLFTDPHKIDVRVQELRLLEGELPGFSWGHVDRADLQASGLSIADAVVGGIRSFGDRSVDPEGLVRSFARACALAGVELRIGEEAVLEDNPRGAPTVKVGAERLAADRVVVAAGVWTNKVLAGIGEHVALQAGKGYGYDLPVTRESPTETMYLAEARVAITPLERKVRVAGTMGFGGIDERIRPRRAGGILTGIGGYLTAWPDFSRSVEAWTGLRPMTPDGVPLIGPLRKHPEVLVATGHAMLGVSLAIVTGRLISALIEDDARVFSIPSLMPNRFSS